MADHNESQVNAQKSELDSGTYEILRSRLEKWGKELRSKLEKLNADRKNVFGSIDTRLISTERITTENNCIPRDMISLNSFFIFGYNVHIGLKSETTLSDIFSIYQFKDLKFNNAGLDKIRNEIFEADFKELFKYYKNTFFEKFAVIGPYLYMVFRIGKNSTDIKTFKWLISGETLKYEGNRSEHEFKFPAQFEFEWNRTSREYHRKGKYPHISVLDKVFIETIGGDLTIKVEDNTDTGEGIYTEQVEDKDQKLDDAEIHFADLGNIILLKIRPFNEKDFRYIVYNHKIKKANRIDAIKDSCVLLPDNHGIIFSKGYYLQTGEFRVFDSELQDLRFEKKIQSMNGEDFIYVFYNQEQGAYVLLPYNLIEQNVENSIFCHGYSFFPNGELTYFTHQSEPMKHHIVQIWQTPFVGKDYIPPVVPDSYLYKIGNKDIVRCMADCAEVLNLLNKNDDAYSNLYLDIIKKSQDVLDAYFWIKKEEAYNLGEALSEIKGIASSTIEEFEKVVRIKNNTREQTKKQAQKTKELFDFIRKENFTGIDPFVKTLSSLRTLRGEVISLKDLRYADIGFAVELEKQIAQQTEAISQNCVSFLLQDNALDPYNQKIQEQKNLVDQISKVAEANKTEENILLISSELEMLISIVSNLKIEDATQTTRIIENISVIFSDVNQLKASLKNKKQNLRKIESASEFFSQIKLIDQSIVNYLDIIDTPEKCDEYLNKLMVQVEELEGKFSDFEEFIKALTEKREEIYGAFENKKLSIIELRNNKSNSLLDSGDRILKGAKNKAYGFKTAAEINGYFASDLMIDKVRDIIRQLTGLNDTTKAEDLTSRLKTLKEDALRQLKDNQDLFVTGQNIVKFGTYHFGVNTQSLDLTMVNKNGEMFYHLTGTGFFEKVEDQEFLKTKPVWSQLVVSENDQVYKGEYLAYLIYTDTISGKGVSFDQLYTWDQEKLAEYVQQFMSSRYAEGYIKGVNDKDAAFILRALIDFERDIDLLRYSAPARACARFYWTHEISDGKRDILNSRLKGAGAIMKVFPATREFGEIKVELSKGVSDFLEKNPLFDKKLSEEVSEYLFYELTRGDEFVVSGQAAALAETFTAYLKKKKHLSFFHDTLKKIEGNHSACFDLIRNWLKAFVSSEKIAGKDAILDEVAGILLDQPANKPLQAELECTLEKLSGNHPLINNGKYTLHFNSFMSRLKSFSRENVPVFENYLSLKANLIRTVRDDMRLEEFKTRVLSSFVRNKLIDEVYLPLIGANLAKQMGVAGEQKRTDLMGMLLLISPPGYGKTTLMEYVASKLGLIFMKINGPAIGHKITSLDPSEASNASTKEELEKLALAFEMGDNVMIYVDDIQHCNPEFLQKFISLCDAQRKIEGVYKGRSRTYDFRGKKVCVVMAGNPYTESGDKFRIPDMLANRADTYNLGDIIGDKGDVFRLSYIENCLTSNSITSKVLQKSLKDVYSFIRMAETGDKTGLDFENNYSAEEANEMVMVLNKLKAVREIVLKINMEYIHSASQADEFRVEPPFKLQGSYRNMNKMAEKINPIMNEQELKTMILSHYRNESQTLTTGAEANFLKFKEIAGFIDEKEQQRWEDIKSTFRKNQKFRNIDQNGQMGQLLTQLSALGEGLDGIKDVLAKGQKN